MGLQFWFSYRLCWACRHRRCKSGRCRTARRRGMPAGAAARTWFPSSCPPGWPSACCRPFAPFAIPLIFANRWDSAIPAMAFLSVAQCLLPLTMVRAGQALLDGRLARTLAATGMAVGVVVGASWCGAQFATHDLEMTALYVSAGYLVGNFGFWLLLAWPLGVNAIREGMHALGATTLGMAILPIAHWGFAGGSGQLVVWLSLWGLFAVLALVAWRGWAVLTRLAQRDRKRNRAWRDHALTTPQLDCHEHQICHALRDRSADTAANHTNLLGTALRHRSNHCLPMAGGAAFAAGHDSATGSHSMLPESGGPPQFVSGIRCACACRSAGDDRRETP